MDNEKQIDQNEKSRPDLYYLQNHYWETLTHIGDIRFTPREIDVLACTLNNRGTSKTANLLSISPRTVITHTTNIMRKVECNSREAIIDFIESSGKLTLLRKHYINLLIDNAFKISLKDLAKLKSSIINKTVILYWKNGDKKGALLLCLKTHLENENSPIVISESGDNVVDVQDKLVLIFKESEGEGEAAVIIDEFENCYFAIFEIFKTLLEPATIDKIISQFNKSYENLQMEDAVYYSSTQEPQTKNDQVFRKKFKFINKNIYLIFTNVMTLIASILTIGALTYGAVTYQNDSHSQIKPGGDESEKTLTIRSDLIIPTESALLQRPKLISKLDSGFQNQKGIKAAAIIGPGGAGKTTLARQYGKLQDANIVWEINAQTQGTLYESFESLAYALSENHEEKQILKELRLTSKPLEREEKLILFVRDKLKKHNKWFMIFDNVEKFADIQKYFPRDETTWGSGRILLTTRDSHIQHNKHVDHAIEVGELDSEEKLRLFSLIIKNGDLKSLNSDKIKETKQFLSEIPSFPLDVSIAGYFLKSTNTTYPTYLDSIQKNQKEFTDIQENLLKDAGDYLNTRYQIITLSLKELLDKNKDFDSLLLFISLLDSQNIPVDLLKTFKDEMIVDNFIFHLKMFSLITNESTPSVSPSLSIHRTTQAITLNFLNKHLDTKRKEEIMSMISNGMNTYIIKAVDENDLLKIKSHCKVLLDHSDLLPINTKAVVRSALGAIYFYLGNYQRTIDHLEKNLKINFQENKLDQSILARSKSYIGTAYRILGNYERSKKNLEESLEIYKTYLPEEQTKIAWILSQLGIVQKELGNYKLAEELIKQGISKDKQFFQEENIKIPWGESTLATVYIEQGRTQEAKELLEQSYLKYKRLCSECTIRLAWVTALLGSVYHDLGDNKKAKTLLENSLAVYSEHLFDYHIEINRTSVYLAKVYRDLGDIESSIKLLQNLLVTTEKNFDKNHRNIAFCLLELAKNYSILEELETAQTLLTRASSILAQKNHPALYLAQELQGDIQSQKAVSFQKAGNISSARQLNSEAEKSFQEALKTAEARYPANSIYVQKLKAKMKNLKLLP